MKKLILLLLFIPIISLSQIEGKQRDQLILRGATIINSTGVPLGPVDIVIEKYNYKKFKMLVTQGVPINEDRRPKLSSNGVEIDCEGSYILPGFIDTHGHIGGRSQGASPDYVFKLWMAHGVTTIREPGGSLNHKLKLELKNKSKKNTIIAPGFTFSTFNSRVKSPEEARIGSEIMLRRGQME